MPHFLKRVWKWENRTFQGEARDKKETGGHGPWVKMGQNGRSFDEKCKVVMVKNTLVKKLQGLVFFKILFRSKEF